MGGPPLHDTAEVAGLGPHEVGQGGPAIGNPLVTVGQQELNHKRIIRIRGIFGRLGIEQKGHPVGACGEFLYNGYFSPK